MQSLGMRTSTEVEYRKSEVRKPESRGDPKAQQDIRFDQAFSHPRLGASGTVG